MNRFNNSSNNQSQQQKSEKTSKIGGYTQLVNDYIRNPNVPSIAKDIANVIASDRSDFNPTIAEITKRVYVCKNTVIKYIKWLVDFGILIKGKLRNGKNTNKYWFATSIKKGGKKKKSKPKPLKSPSSPSPAPLVVHEMHQEEEQLEKQTYINDECNNYVDDPKPQRASFRKSDIDRKAILLSKTIHGDGSAKGELGKINWKTWKQQNRFYKELMSKHGVNDVFKALMAFQEARQYQLIKWSTNARKEAESNIQAIIGKYSEVA